LQQPVDSKRSAFRKVTMIDAGGVTERDVKLAEEINKLAIQ
jgi:pterin-4a-carbinolamine dehydratase